MSLVLLFVGEEVGNRPTSLVLVDGGRATERKISEREKKSEWGGEGRENGGGPFSCLFLFPVSPVNRAFP